MLLTKIKVLIPLLKAILIWKIILLQKKNKNNLQYVYTGLQIIKPEVFSNFDDKIFSMNKIWDKLIINNQLFGIESNINFFHVSTLDIYKSLIKKNF